MLNKQVESTVQQSVDKDELETIVSFDKLIHANKSQFSPTERWQVIEQLELSFYELLYLLLLKLVLPGLKNISPQLTATTEKKKREMPQLTTQEEDDLFVAKLEDEDDLSDEEKYILKPILNHYREKMERLKKKLPLAQQTQDAAALQVALCELNRLFTKHILLTTKSDSAELIVYPDKLFDWASSNYVIMTEFNAVLMYYWDQYVQTDKRGLELDTVCINVYKKLFPEIYSEAIDMLIHIYGRAAMRELQRQAGKR